MIRILFVDDDPCVLSGLQRMLRPLRHEWAMAFADSGPSALEALSREPFDVIVSDMRMPGMSGAQLLAEAARRRPEAARIVLSGQADREHLDLLADIPHEYLSKPCDAARLQEAVQRAHRDQTRGAAPEATTA